MIYLDSAATTMQKPPQVARAMARAVGRMASPGRGGHLWAGRAAETAFACRQAAAELFGITEPERVVFTSNATHGLNIAIRTLVRAGDRVVISGWEHNAVTRPLHSIGAEIVTARAPLFDRAGQLAAFAQGPTRVRNVAHLRIKESDRITAPATELARLGVRVDEHDDGLTVHGTGPDGPVWDEAARFSAHNDHRIAMSLALLGLPHGKRMDALLDDPLVVRKSFPTFWKVWERLL